MDRTFGAERAADSHQSPHHERLDRAARRALARRNARRRAWRAANGDHDTYRQLMQDGHAAGYLFHYEDAEGPAPGEPSIGHQLLVDILRIATACLTLAALIVMWDLACWSV